MRIARRTLILMWSVAALSVVTAASVFAVNVGSTTIAVEVGGSVVQDSSMVLTSVGNTIGATYPFSGTKIALTATDVATLDGGGGATIYTLPDHQGRPIRDYFEFTVEAPDASTAFIAGELRIRWIAGTQETVADLTLAIGDTDGSNLDGATFRLEWPANVATGDTVHVVYEEAFSDGASVTVSHQTLTFTSP